MIIYGAAWWIEEHVMKHKEDCGTYEGYLCTCRRCTCGAALFNRVDGWDYCVAGHVRPTPSNSREAE